MGRLIDADVLEEEFEKCNCDISHCRFLVCPVYNQKIIEAIPKADVVNILDEIKTELYATAEMHDDGDYYLRKEWIGEIFDNARRRHEICK